MTASAATATGPAPVPDGSATTRDRLLAAAVAVFREQGYDGARVQDIARAAGLTTGAIYANFRGKADLLLEAIGARARAELREVAAARTARDPGDLAAIEVLRLLGDLLTRSGGGDNRPLLLDAVVASRRDPELAALVAGAMREREDRISRLVRAAQAEGSIDPAIGVETLARFCLMLGAGALVVRSAGLDAPDDAGWDALVVRLLAAFAPARGGDAPTLLPGTTDPPADPQRDPAPPVKETAP